MKRLFRQAARLALIVPILIGAACSTDRRPNVILVTLDTLRADHLGLYGYRRPTSPRLDALARQATVYDRAIAAAPWTVPTHASLFTGKPVFQHGAHTVPMEDHRREGVRPLHSRHLTLAELFRDSGFRTAAFIANDAYLAPRLKMDQGFELYHVERLYADRLNERLLPWLDANRDQPFFLFVNYMDTHRPYNLRPRPEVVDRRFEYDNAELIEELYGRILPAEQPPPEELLRELIDQYDTAVANVDAQLGVLLDRLERLGLDDDTLVIVTSDHGEYFGEHFLIEHSKDVYQEALWVPLVVRGPGQRDGVRDETVVVSYDLPRMILSYFPAAFAAPWETQFLEVAGRHPVVAENYYSRGKDLFHPVWGARFRRVRTVVYDWPLKYIHSSDERHELYRLDDDPRESNNLVEAEPETVERLRDELARYVAQRGVAAMQEQTAPLTDEERRRLESLGYL